MPRTAVVLAGGLGTRLRAVLGDDLPKVLAPVAGRPWLHVLLDQLASAGVAQAVLATGWQAERVMRAAAAWQGSVTTSESRESEPLGTGGAVRLATARVDAWPVLVLNGDSYVAVDLAAFLAFHRASAAAASLVLTRVADAGRFGTVVCAADGAVQAFREKAPGAGAGWINAGAYLLERQVLERIEPGTAASLECEVFPALVGAGLAGFQGGGRFIDIGVPESYAEAEQFLAAGVAR